MYVLGRSGWIEKDVATLAAKISPALAGLLLSPSVTKPKYEADEALRRAKSYLVRTGPAYGILPGEISAPKDPESLHAFVYNIETAFSAVEKSLDALAAEIERSRQDTRATRLLPLALAVVLCFVGIAAFAWGVVHGSKIALFGAGGGVVFSITFAYRQMHAYNRDQLLLQTLVARLRSHIAICRLGDPTDNIDCLKHVLGTMDQYFAEFRAVADESARMRKGKRAK